MNRYTVDVQPAGDIPSYTIATTASYVIALRKAQDWRKDNPTSNVDIMCHPDEAISPWKVWDLDV